jgi:hypothetical protein
MKRRQFFFGLCESFFIFLRNWEARIANKVIGVAPDLIQPVFDDFSMRWITIMASACQRYVCMPQTESLGCAGFTEG